MAAAPMSPMVARAAADLRRRKREHQEAEHQRHEFAFDSVRRASWEPPAHWGPPTFTESGSIKGHAVDVLCFANGEHVNRLRRSG